jgi:putative ABC transport system ATP-binding protein
MSNVQTTPAIKLANVIKSYDVGAVRVNALRGVDMVISSERFSMIVGPSGSGKTTLLNLIGCIDTPSAGLIHIAGQNTAELSDNRMSDFRARKIGFVFQGFSLVPVLSAYENVEYPLLLVGMPPAQRRKATMAMLEAVGLADHAKQRPNELSGGQKQRVAIARALIKQPAIVLADEPTANLDTQTGASIIQLMRRMQYEQKTTFIFSTHDQHLMSHADETFVIRDGRLVEHVSGAART